jgi:hypothetical protein
VADILKHSPPKPSKPQAAIELVMNEISPYLTESDRNITHNLIKKHVEKPHPVYMHMVSPFPHVHFCLDQQPCPLCPAACGDARGCVGADTDSKPRPSDSNRLCATS